MLAPQDLGAIYAQVGWDLGSEWDPGSLAVAAVAGGGRRAPVFHHPGGGAGVGGTRDGGEGWLARGATRDQLHLWGVHPPPGLARQYATTRHVEGAGGMVSCILIFARGKGGEVVSFFLSRVLVWV